MWSCTSRVSDFLKVDGTSTSSISFPEPRLSDFLSLDFRNFRSKCQNLRPCYRGRHDEIITFAQHATLFIKHESIKHVYRATGETCVYECVRTLAFGYLGSWVVGQLLDICAVGYLGIRVFGHSGI